MRKYLFFGKKPKYESLSWWENFMGGHITIFGIITIFGENAMHWGVTIKIRKKYLCFRLPFRCFGSWWPLYLYISPDGTPASATWSLFKTRYQR